MRECGEDDRHHTTVLRGTSGNLRGDLMFFELLSWQLSSGKLAGQYTGRFFSADLSVPTRMGSDMFSLSPQKYLAALQKYWCHPKPFTSICPLLSLCCGESGTSLWLCHPSSLQVMKKDSLGTSLAVQWLRLLMLDARGFCLIPDQELRYHMPCGVAKSFFN